MGDESPIGVSTGEAAKAAVNAASAAQQYESIDLDFRAVIAATSEAVVEPAMVAGVSEFCDEHVYDLVRLRAHMSSIGTSAEEAGQAAAQTDRGNAERFHPWAI